MNHHDLTPFESDLLTELRGVVAERAARPPQRRRRSALAAAAAGVGALATGVAVTTLGGGSPAYAVETTAAGDVVVRIHELTDAEGLERALAAQGVSAEVSYGGQSTGTLVVDEDGNATPGPAPELPEPAEQPASGDSGPAWSAGEGESGSTPQRADTPCGDVASLPVSLVRTGGDFVITIDGDSPFAKEDLRITTLDRGEGAELVVTFSPEPGAMCGLGTSTP